MKDTFADTASHKYLPILDRYNCIWKLPREFRENEGLAILGFLQDYLKSKDLKSLTLDFTDVDWADPQPLLYLGILLAESTLRREQITINFGGTNERNSNASHRIFLKFLAQQGFLTVLSQYAQIACNGELQSDPQALKLKLSVEPQATHFINADCIFAKLINTKGFLNSQSSLHETVEMLVKEAQDRVMVSAFGSVSVARDILFQKLRKLLYELLLNIAEHSNPTGETAFAGIYARIRGGKPPLESECQAWAKLFSKAIQIHGQKQFNPNRYADWLELYICDAGIGLTAEIKKWRISNDPDVARDLKVAQNSKNPLESIAYRLFRSPLSRHDRHDSDRTAVTGLQHLGHLLSIGGDYCRIYTQNGCWVGGHLPWQRSNYSRKDIRITKSPSSPAAVKPITGTAYAFSIQPKHNNIAAFMDYWFSPTDRARELIILALRQYDHSLNNNVLDLNDNERAVFYDRRTETNCLPPLDIDVISTGARIVVLRPPRLSAKQDIAQWLRIFAGRRNEPPTVPISAFVIADLTPFQLLTFRELFLDTEKSDKATFVLYLVTEHWAVCALTAFFGLSSFSVNNDVAKDFSETYATGTFSLADLAIVLRYMDSQIFWVPKTKYGTTLPFLNANVEWIVANKRNKAIKLSRYLDFPHALADPERYRACRRALGRCLSLFPEHFPIAADQLIASLLNDVLLTSYTAASNRENSSHSLEHQRRKTLIVGSVAVTAGTVRNLPEAAKSDVLHLLIHGDSPANGEDARLSALLWLPKDADLNYERDTSPSLMWRRIPNTPYIAPQGEQAISILRYQRRGDRSLNFDAPLYGRTPEETYKDFERLGALKTGHWKYGNRHDLLTINLRVAFWSSFMELGPLYSWMKTQFDQFFVINGRDRSALAQVLLYPSHPVTDFMLDRIRQDPGFKDILPSGGVIPVKFLGTRTVSPLLASHLVGYQIEKLVESNKWSEWSAVIMDDGTVTGKHLREMKQFLQALKAKQVFTIALLDRTGLPVQEALIQEYLEINKRFWRWDVPDLGNSRDCPLCHGLAIAQTYANKLMSDRQKARLQEWIDLWSARDVYTGWLNNGLRSTPFETPISITFGTCVSPNNERVEKRLFLNNSTSATSLLLELTRLTTRADVALKKADRIAETYPDAAIEIIASQLLLFLDELSATEKRHRFMRLLELIWTRPTTTVATSLAGLCITLIDHDILKYLWNYCKKELLPESELGNLDAILAVNILYSRYRFLTKEIYTPSSYENSIEFHNNILLGLSGTVCDSIREFLTELNRNPSDPARPSVHDTAFYLHLRELKNAQSEISEKGYIVWRDLNLIEQLLTKLKELGIGGIEQSELSELGKFVKDLSIALEEKNDKEVLHLCNQMMVFLFGQASKVIGFVKKLSDQLLKEFENLYDFQRKMISVITRSLRQNWEKNVDAKRQDASVGDRISKWKRKDGGLVTPIISLSTQEDSVNSFWMFCDSFIQGVLKDTLLNVYHIKHREIDTESASPMQIPDPWAQAETSTTAHMWWRLTIDSDYAVFVTANATDNKEIPLKHKVNIAGLERIRGSIKASVDDSTETFIAYTTIRIPLYSAFIKEAS